jgi:naphthoate synthase
MANQVSELFEARLWKDVEGFDALTDVTYHRHVSLGAVRVAFNRPEVRNAFRPQTVDELNRVLLHAAEDSEVGVVLLTGNGPSPKDGGWAFSSGGDQRVRGKDGYQYQDGTSSSGRLHILEVQRLIRFMPKVVIALIPGWAAGGGHSLNVIADLSIASREHAMFKQTDATVGSFDAGYGSAYLARQVGQKFAREIFFLAEEYDAKRAYEMGVINAVVDHAELENTGIAWAERILGQSPQSIRMLKYAFNAVDDGLVGQQIFAGEATRLAYGTNEAVEGRDSFLERRKPDWSAYPWHF